MRHRRSRVERDTSREMMRAERQDLRRLLAHLTAEQWDAPSLCEAWTVRELVIHMIGWDDLVLYRTRREHARALWTFIVLSAASLGSMDRLNKRIQERTGDLDAQAIAARFAADDRDDLRWLFDGTNPTAHLAEYLIHAQDIRRPLGLEEPVDPARLLAGLRGVTQLPGVRRRAWSTLAKQRLQATDVPWERGWGRLSRMRGIDVLLHLAGRQGPARATP